MSAFIIINNKINTFIPSESHSVGSDSLWPHGLYNPWNSPGQNTGVGSCSLLQGTFPTQGSNPGVPICRQILYPLWHKGSPRILKWVAYPFSSRSSQSRNRNRVSCIADGFFTNRAIREACLFLEMYPKDFTCKCKLKNLIIVAHCCKRLEITKIFTKKDLVKERMLMLH